MADLTHLEKMGSELKCPICLSLLNAAATLGCNHVFCNACIEKSMKSGSDCPVCKVPYRRREVRPAPHMDNLVSIYKSMEVASGINIFVTQNLSSAKLSEGGDKQVEGDDNCSKSLNAEVGEITANKQRALDDKGPRKRQKSNRKDSASFSEKPSFPRKKRVQVPQCPLPETSSRDVKSVSRLTKINDEEPRKNEVFLGDKGEPVLSPFFWLRERDEDEEKSSQHSDLNQPTDSMTLNVLSFSDIKDSMDESPSKFPMEEVGCKSTNDLDFFDSEMFEWTQRPCSPELCSSPFKLLVEDIATTETASLVASTSEEFRNEMPNESSNQNVGIPDVVVHDMFLTKGADTQRHNGSKKPTRRGRKRKEIALKKCANRYTESALGGKETQCLSKKQVSNIGDSVGSLTAGTKRNKKVHFGTDAQTSLENSENIATEILAFSEGEKSGKNGRAERVVKCRKRSKKQKLDSVGDKLLGDQSNQIQLDDCTIPNLSTSTSAIATITNQKKGYEKQANSSDCIPINAYDNIIPEKLADAQEIADKQQCDTNVTLFVNPDSTAKKVRLQERESLDNLQCAFCLSSEESEASGRMVHYLNGKLINRNDGKNSKVVHAHWNCVEWAPNVYFDGDTVINLEAELSRSRRIKCNCCGNKGAALGCYEKSCRKSFHVTCAKLMRQCQWDTNNFVMLCPLHPELPSQGFGNEEQKNNCPPKRQSYTKHTAATREVNNNQSTNFRGLCKKLVLCCSALTVAEREVVSEFQRLSGVAVLQKWDDSITHIVASTDKNEACKRTLKVLMGILKGKWVLSIKWIKACIQAMRPVEEEHYEITVDVHGIRDGPRLGRLRVLNNQPRLFAGLKFFFTADFEPSYKGYLQELVNAAGGTIVLRKPAPSNQNIPFSSSSNCQVVIIYSVELPETCNSVEKDKIFNRRRSDAVLLARSAAAKVATNSWLLNSIAGSKLESLAE